MAEQQQQHAPGGHYSNFNKVPNVKEFLSKLDADKKDRDARLDQDAKAQPQNEATPHQNAPQSKSSSRKTVTDPTTETKVEIENVGKDYIEASKNPKVQISLLRTQSRFS